MKKIIVSLVALAAIAPAIADSSCGCKSKNCKPKKVRVVYVGAPNAAENMYGEVAAMEPTQVPMYEPEPVEYVDMPEPVYEKPAPRRTKGNSREWYIGGRIGLDLLSWENKYNATPADAIVDPGSDHDDYVFEPVFGGDIFLGYHFTPSVRGDIELGYISQYDDTDNGITFKLSTFYATFNAYYDFLNHFYLGGSLGFAFPRADMEWEHFTKSGTETDLSMNIALMAGYTYDLSQDVVLDLRYRLGGFWGPTFTRGVVGFDPLQTLETKVGFVLDNQISIGLRYEF